MQIQVDVLARGRLHESRSEGGDFWMNSPKDMPKQLVENMR